MQGKGKPRARRTGAQLSTKQVKAVATIAKKAVLRQAETKSPITNVNITLGDNLVYAQNLIYFIPQGDSSTAVDGAKMNIRNINIRGQLTGYNTSVDNAPITFRVAVVKTKKALTNTNTAITATDVLRSNTSYNASLGHFDLHSVTLLEDKTFSLPTPNIANTAVMKPFDMNIRVNKDEYYDKDNSGYLKGGNYYVIITASRWGAGSVNAGAAYLQWTVNFKDS